MNRLAKELIKNFDANLMDEFYFAAVKGQVKTIYYKKDVGYFITFFSYRMEVRYVGDKEMLPTLHKNAQGARYEIFVQKLKSIGKDKTLKAYASSKNVKQFSKKAKQEYPEFFI
jgi:hypothetical protein